MDLIIKCQGYTAEKQAQLASTGLCGYALDWWYQTANTRRQYGEQQISSWYEMKAVMKKRFVAKRYGQTDLERKHSQSGSAKGHIRTPKDEPKTYYGGEAPRKLQLHQAYLEELQNPQLKQDLRNMIDQSLTDVMEKPQQTSAPRPASRDYELCCYQKEPVEKKEETAEKQGVREQAFESEPTTLCEADNLDNHLKQEDRTSVICGHVPGQNQSEEGVLNGSPKAHELAVTTVVKGGDIIESFSCDLLTTPPEWINIRLVEYLRDVKGLQQVVFEPGGSFSVSIRSNNNLVQKTVSYKLELQGFFTPEKQDLRSNLFEGREDGVILSICSKNRGETGGNTPLISPITDQNQLRSTKQKLVVVKKMPKLENEYGDHYTRPPDPMQHENQVIMSIGQGVLREIIDILLGIHKELVRPPDQSARFLLVFRDLMLSFYPGEHRTHAETAMVEACLWSKWREAFAAAAGYELNGKESFVCYILRHVRSLEMIEQGSKSLLKHGKGLQSWVFDPGDDHVSIILQVSDLRTNPFEGREDGVTLISSILKNMKSRKEEAMKWIMARPDELYGKLKGLIHEVLDREKAMGLDVAFIKHGLTLDNHGRPVITLIDKEMDRMKLVRQEMEWEIQSDREMDWSNRHMRELSWKWKIENQSRKWNMMRTFIIRMSIRSSLVGPGTRWIEPKKELFEKGLYRPEKWKDKPAWFMIGPI
ncbi:hypothetical protein IGI04_019862 [Brassica rapa subsp. trilocularis]|uniref:Uncharacterized protein n=1 Tax=Brassica rapa subsp. trilocularis TaxID=1813537 RepID=A0ABQ7MH39_BRACM|nr:hypothetical protein IGI04_019862 [Brassica rapa subsp. trilocularis]